MKLRTLPVLIALVIIGSASYGAEPTRGAFGLEFGTAIPPWTSSTLIGRQFEEMAENSGLSFTTSVPTPNPLFSEYVATVSSTSHKLFRIKAAGVMNSRLKLMATTRKLVDLLTEKYGAPVKEPNSSSSPSIYTFRSGDVRIQLLIDWDRFGDHTFPISLTYEDTALKTLADKELEEGIDAPVESTGL